MFPTRRHRGRQTLTQASGQYPGGYRPVKFGSRRSLNAAMPSIRSVGGGGERLVRALEIEGAATRSVSKLALSSRFERPSERVGPAASCDRERDRGAGQLLGGRRSGTRGRGRRPPGPIAPSPSMTIAFARGSPTRRGSRYAPPASTTSPHSCERPHEPGRVVDEHEVAREREVRAGADGGAVHRGDRRLVELPELADERLHADAQRLGRCCGCCSPAPRPWRRSTPRGPCPRRTRRRRR